MIYFTSDWHLGHRNIIDYCNRPFSSVEEMNETIIDNMNSIANEEDQLIVVGDICMGKIGETLPLLDRINAMIYLVPGNHDRVHPMNKPKTLRRFVPEYLKYMNIGNTHSNIWGSFNVCHFPYTGDSQDADRYEEWRMPQSSTPIVCGHVHDAWKIKDNQINVGVDAWDFMPVSIETIDEIVKEMK